MGAFFPPFFVGFFRRATKKKRSKNFCQYRERIKTGFHPLFADQMWMLFIFFSRRGNLEGGAHAAHLISDWPTARPLTPASWTSHLDPERSHSKDPPRNLRKSKSQTSKMIPNNVHSGLELRSHGGSYPELLASIRGLLLEKKKNNIIYRQNHCSWKLNSKNNRCLLS